MFSGGFPSDQSEKKHLKSRDVFQLSLFSFLRLCLPLNLSGDCHTEGRGLEHFSTQPIGVYILTPQHTTQPELAYDIFFSGCHTELCGSSNMVPGVQVPIGLTSSKATRLRPILGTDIIEMQMDGDLDLKKGL